MVTVFVLKKIIRTGNYLLLTDHRICYHLCICQIEASTCPPPPPRAFDTFAVLGRREFTFAVPGRREFDYQSLPGAGEFDPHALGVRTLNCTFDFM